MKKRKLISILLILCLTAVSLTGCSLLGSCSLFQTVEFTKTSLSIGVGRTVDLDEYIQISNSVDKSYSLISDNDTVVQVVSVSCIKAVSKGRAKVRAELASGVQSSAIEIIVEFDEPSSLMLRTTGELFQSAQESSPVTFTATVDAGADPDLNFDWNINGIRQTLTGARNGAKSFTLDRMPAGEYIVEAVCRTGGVTAQKAVRVYEDYGSPILSYGGERIFEDIPVLKPIIKIEVDNPQDNPDLFAEWFIGGELVKSELTDQPFFELDRGIAGKYKISAKINGQQVFNAQDGEYLEIIYKGKITPAIDFEYASYPKVEIKWINREETFFNVTVTRKSDGAVVLNKDIDAKEGGCSLLDAMDLTKAYNIRVTALDSADAVFMGGNFAEYEFLGVSVTAFGYLKKTYLSGNCYMTGDDDIYDVFEYLMIFRPGAGSNGLGDSEITLYMGYTSEHNVTSMSNSFRDKLNITGSYRWSITGNLTRGGEITIKMTFYNQNSPTAEGSLTAGKAPQYVYIAPKTSQTGYESALPVDGYPLSDSKAETSDQLFITVQRGLRPDCTPDSAAGRLYKKAREVLSDIIDESMDGADKSAAIYDWVMFAVSYDYNVTSISDTAVAVKQAAFYLEGVFDTGFAVCDGISKAYSLLCNMAGLRCVRIVGSARSSETWGEHAWNKVLLDGGWYLVDATWGIAKVSNSNHKFGTKAWFLLNDSDVSGRRIEKGGVYPHTAVENYNYQYKKGMYVFDSADLSQRMQAIAAQIREARTDKSYTVRGEDLYADYYALEFAVSPALIPDFKKNNGNPLSPYLSGYMLNIYADAQKLNNMVVVGVE